MTNKLPGDSNVFRLDYFERNCYLAQSPQLYKLIAIQRHFPRIIEIGPVFRAKNSERSRQPATPLSSWLHSSRRGGPSSSSLMSFTGVDPSVTVVKSFYRCQATGVSADSSHKCRPRVSLFEDSDIPTSRTVVT